MDISFFNGATAVRADQETDLDARFLELVAKSGLSLDNRGTGTPVRCLGHRASGGPNIHLAAIQCSREELTLVTPSPLEEGARIVIERCDRHDKERFIEGIILNPRPGCRPGDNCIHVATLKITHGTF